ncbi:TonB-dependent receptor family protein [Plebeiibacterium sediminum]|uniref:TonB-dependent receptor n=1 Tax=Plebeiibacterium sediminum TaxID=2992112 RepID=A0AAE3MAR9_9BACT|nr:TonB-dependent receptor family protein [Plebeiobacterium sediminum]MCW3789595.1 TonB-dependent receptor [Plebeiobacterium sediminum]
MSNLFLRFVIFYSIMILIPFNSFATESGILEGNIIDGETLEVVSYASVELLASDDSIMINAVIANVKGEFMIEKVPYGKYLLRISCMGYKKMIKSEFEVSVARTLIKFNDIKLDSELNSLEGVVVKGYIMTGVIKDDKTIYRVNSKSAEIAQSGLELLRQLPDVTVSYFSDNVKLAGCSNIRFQVNGRQVDNNFLTQLNSGLVDKIEVINNPGSNYDGSVDAVINIVLKREFKFGMGGQLRLQLPTSPKTILSKNNANVDIYLNKIRFYVSGKYNWNDYTVENLNERTTQSGTYLNQKTYREGKDNKFVANSGFDWFINDRNSLSASGSIQPIISNNKSYTTLNAYTTEDVTTFSTGITSNTNKDYLCDYSIYYQHKFPQEEHQISIENYRSNKINEHNSNYYEQADLIIPSYFNINNQSTESNNIYSYVKIDYTYPLLNKLKLSTGYNWYYLHKDYIYSNITASFSDVTDFKESRHSFYLSLSSNLGKLNLQTGVRYEVSNINIVHVYDTINSTKYFLPSIKANYKLNEQNMLRFSYRKSLGRPGINHLSPANYSDDSYTQSKGNPGLMPSIKNRFEIEHRVQLNKSMYVNYKPYLSFTKDGISQVSYIVSDSILRKQYWNVNSELEYGLICSGMFSVKDVWMTSPSFTYYRKKLDAMPEYGINKGVNDNSWRLNISSQLMLPKDWVLFLEFNYEAPTIGYQYKKYEYYDFVFGFFKSFNKKFSVSAFTLNPWSNHFIFDKRTYSTGSIVQNVESKLKYDYIFLIKLGYRFNTGKTGKKINRVIEKKEIFK